MTITPDDLRFLASVRMTDEPDSGGPMSNVVLVDGQKNSVFHDLTEIDEASGRQTVRKVFAACLSADDTPYLSAHVVVDDVEGSPGVHEYATLAPAFEIGNPRALAPARSVQDPRPRPTPAYLEFAEFGLPVFLMAGGSYSPPRAPFVRGLDLSGKTLSVGGVLSEYSVDARTVLQERSTGLTYVRAYSYPRAVGGDPFEAMRHRRYYFRQVVSFSETSITLDEDLPEDPALVWGLEVLYSFDAPRVEAAGSARLLSHSGNRLRVSSTSVKGYPLTDGATVQEILDLKSSGDWPPDLAAFAPGYFYRADYAIPTARYFPALSYLATMGRATIFGPNCLALVHYTKKIPAATYVNGNTVNVGLDNLESVVIRAANGRAHATFTRGTVPVAGSGCSVTLETGIVSFTNVSGILQPITIEARISELTFIRSLSSEEGQPGPVLVVSKPLSRAYPSGAKVSTALRLGDWQARVSNGRALAAWLGDWGDYPPGGGPIAGADANTSLYPIAVSNRGAISERWSVQFQSPTTFRVYGQSVGLVGDGTTGSDFSPNNPATGAPYFTLPFRMWSAGWLPGNAYRFTTYGANAPLLLFRIVEPQTLAPEYKLGLQLRGYLNSPT